MVMRVFIYLIYLNNNLMIFFQCIHIFLDVKYVKNLHLFSCCLYICNAVTKFGNIDWAILPKLNLLWFLCRHNFFFFDVVVLLSVEVFKLFTGLLSDIVQKTTKNPNMELNSLYVNLKFIAKDHKTSLFCEIFCLLKINLEYL